MLSTVQAPEQVSDAISEIVEDAPAKINLALHVTGRRPDGYHLLESIVTFAHAGDQLTFSRSNEDGFSLTGRFSHMLQDVAGNLVVEARDCLRNALLAQGIDAPPVSIHLEKNLPVAAGIGGGSADAAATLRGLLRFWNTSLPDAELHALALSLGADVPMCLKGEPLVARGIGDELAPLPSLPVLPLVLGNPMVGVSTPQVFSGLTRRDNPGIGPLAVAAAGDWMEVLRRLRNDLEAAARQIEPQISEISVMIESEGAQLVRMSGSGATCFGIFSSFAAAQEAAERLSTLRPDWYFQATETLSGRLQ